MATLVAVRIAFFLRRFPVLSETFIVGQVAGLLEAGHDVRIFARRPRRVEKEHALVRELELLTRVRYRPDPVRGPLRRIRAAFGAYRQAEASERAVARRALNPFRCGLRAFTLRLFIDALYCDPGGDHDILHCHFGGTAVRGLELSRIGALPGRHVTTFHGHDAWQSAERRGGAYRRLFERTAAVTVNSTYTGDRVRELGCPAEKVVKIPLGIDLDQFSYRSPRSVADGGVRLITVGRLMPKKGHRDSIDAFARVAERHPSLRYDIVGDGPLRAELEARARERGQADRIRFLGARTQEEVREHLQQADVFVLASATAEDGDREGQGVVLQEAQASGLPVIATRHNGFPDSVLEGESAFLVPEHDVDALAERIEALVTAPDTWPKMAAAGRAFVEAQFDRRVLTQRLVAVYDDVLADRAPGSSSSDS